MTSPRLAVDIGGTRWYVNPGRHDGQPHYRGVTGITAALPKEAIPRWAARTVAEYAYDHVDEWKGMRRDDIVSYVGKMRMVDKGVVSTLAAIPWEIRDHAAARGSEVHAVVERMANGETYHVEAEVEPWINSAAQYVHECGPEIVFAERTVYEEKHAYAGTLDFYCRYRAFPSWGLCLGDYKTSRGVYPDMGAQINAYANADYYLDADDKEIELPPPDTAVIVHLTPNGYALYPVPLTDAYRRVFLAALEIRRWQADAAKLKKVTVPTLEELVEAEKAARVDKLRARIAGLSTHQALELTLQCRQEGIPTKPSAMTLAQIEQLDALITIYQDADAVIDELQIKQGRHRMWRRMV